MEILLPLGALVALVWAVNFLRFSGLAGGFVAVLFLGSCFSYPFFKAGPLTLDRLMLIALFGFYAIVRCQGSARSIRFSFSDILLIALMMVMGFSTFSHDWRANDGKTAINLAVFYVMPAAMYWMARNSRFDEKQVAFLLSFFALFAAYLGITGIAERFELNSLVFPRYITSPKYPEFLGRARGPFLNPCANGLFLTAGVAAAILSWSKLMLLGRVLMTGAATISVAGIVCTMTRSVWIGAAMAIAVLVTATLPRKFRYGFVIAILIVGCVGMTASWASLQSFKRDKNVAVEDMEKSAKLRPMLAIVAWEMFQDRPLLGFGFGNYLEESLPYFSARVSNKPIELAKHYVQHNVVLSLLTECGLIGTTVYVLLLGTWFVSACVLMNKRAVSLAKRQQGLLFVCVFCSFAVSGFFQDMTIVSMSHMLLFFLGGLVMSLSSNPQNQTAMAPSESAPTDRIPSELLSPTC
jgi:O-antigen ligase